MVFLGPFGPGRPLAFREIPGPGRNREKTQFPGARGPETEKKVTTLSGMVVRNFFAFYVLAHRIPRGGKLRNTGILGHFGLGRPSALREIMGAGWKQGKTLFPGARGPEIEIPHYPGWLSATFLQFMFRPTGPPRAGNHKTLGFLGRTALGT